MTTDEFVSKAKAVHGDKYDYSQSEYTNKRTKLNIICPTHGEFLQLPLNHIRRTRMPYLWKTESIRM